MTRELGIVDDVGKFQDVTSHTNLNPSVKCAVPAMPQLNTLQTTVSLITIVIYIVIFIIILYHHLSTQEVMLLNRYYYSYAIRIVKIINNR